MFESFLAYHEQVIPYGVACFCVVRCNKKFIENAGELLYNIELMGAPFVRKQNEGDMNCGDAAPGGAGAYPGGAAALCG